jgi:predicted dienelactone hydrolase
MTVGHVTVSLQDQARNDRSLTVEAWYPTDARGGSTTRYDLLPGVGFDSPTASEALPPLPGRHPLIVWSHGRTGLRHIYTKLCEGLASHGYVVVSSDHPGDTLFDWLTGANVDDVTNERQRLGDVRFLIDSTLAGLIDPVSSTHVDNSAIFVAGHSYGGLTALISHTGIHGLSGDPRIRAIAGAQAYTRTLPDELLDRISIPTLLLVGSGDVTTPPSTDADPIWSRINPRDDRHRRIDLPHGGHQACSDFSYYMEVLPTIPDVPQLVVDYLESIAAESPPGFRETWRTTLDTQITAISDFFKRTHGAR